MGEAQRSGTPDTDKGSSRRFGAFAGAWDARQAAETLRTLSGAARRPPLGPGEALPGRQEGRLNPHEDGERSSFVMSFMSIAKPSCLKRKLRACSNRLASFRARRPWKRLDSFFLVHTRNPDSPISAASYSHEEDGPGRPHFGAFLSSFEPYVG